MKSHFKQSYLILKVLIIILLLSSLCAADINKRNCHRTDSQKKCIVFSPSIIELIANAEDYHEKKVLIKGYLNLEFEGDAIYIREDDYKSLLARNSIWVDINYDDLTKKQLELNHNYVLIEGTFDAYSFGHMSLRSGTIKNITRLDKGLTLSDISKIRAEELQQ